MTNPFVGLRPFEASEGHLFFGREREVGVLVNLVSTLPVLIIYARSGTGKSSLLNAGIGPRLADDPTQTPVFIGTNDADVASSARRELMKSGWKCDEGIALHVVLTRYWAETDKRAVVILDQFEERLNSGIEHSDLYSTIARLVNEGSDAACIVISIREDYIGGLEPLMRKVPSLLNASYRVPPLSRPALEQAIYGPLQYDEATTVEDKLVETTIIDLHQNQDQSQLASEQAFEPGYFQIVWSTLWEKGQRSRRNKLTVGLYHNLGGASTILKTFTTVRLDTLEPAEAHLFWAMSRYLVLPTGAKVALTVEDLILLQKKSDYLTVPPGRRYVTEGRTVWIADLSPEHLTVLARRLFKTLTSSQSPLFRRIVRDGREEFELLHDLLAKIILRWRSDFEVSFRRDSMQRLETTKRRSVRLRRKALSYAARNIDDNAISGLSSSDHDVVDPVPDLKSIGRSADLKALRGFRQFVKDAAYRGSAFAGEMTQSLQLGSSDEVKNLKKESEWLLSVDLAVEATTNELSYHTLKVTEKSWNTAKSRVVAGLSSLALDHPSSETRRESQAQLLYWLAGWTLGVRTPFRNRRDSSLRDRLAALPKAIGIAVVALVIGAGPLIFGNWLVLAIFPSFNLQYTWLSVGILCAGAALLYAAFVNEAWPSAMKYAPKSFLAVLFPGLAASREHGWWSFVGWWPLPQLTVTVFSAAAAWIFHVIGSSPTAGFNIGLLIGATAGTIMAVAAQDM
jgi:hypothetical protein